MNPKQIFPEEILKTILESGQLDADSHTNMNLFQGDFHILHCLKRSNLVIPRFLFFYKTANYTSESGQNTIYGWPIYFSITIPQTAKNIGQAISTCMIYTFQKWFANIGKLGIPSIDLLSDGYMEKALIYKKGDSTVMQSKKYNNGNSLYKIMCLRRCL